MVAALSGVLLSSAALLAGAQTWLPECLNCHNATYDPVIQALSNTAHGALDGGGNAGCSACHGASEAHRRGPVANAPDVSFGPRWPSRPEDRSGICLGCHEKNQQQFWAGSQHQRENISCDNCHSSHRPRDLADGKQQSEELCLSCHPRVRADMQLPSRHPILEGKTACTDCHNPHGGLGEASLLQGSVNDNCLSCHQDKRGPFLWEHPPVTEDCTLCHRSHGAVNERLLNAHGPALCQQCHSAAFHPSLPYGGDSVGGDGTAPASARNVLGKNCLNCHSAIHGSNHPSGARLTR